MQAVECQQNKDVANYFTQKNWSLNKLVKTKKQFSLRQVYVGYFFGSNWDSDLDECINSIAIERNLTHSEASIDFFIDTQKKLFKRVDDRNYTDKFFSRYYSSDICTSTIRASEYRETKKYFPMLLLEYDLMFDEIKKEFFKGTNDGFSDYGKNLSEVLGYKLIRWERLSKKKAQCYL
jgi:hypothetical protein